MAHVLVVDDSESLRRLVVLALNTAGFMTSEADNGEAALKLASNTKFDLVVTDVNMPIMDGISLTKELRKLKNYKFTPILILTTESSNEMKLKGKSAGATGWIVEPFKPEVLIETIKKVLV